MKKVVTFAVGYKHERYIYQLLSRFGEAGIADSVYVDAHE
jgi:hypothetical protein